MYINKLFLKEFGKFNNREIKLDSGLNVVYGEPGAGKSTFRDCHRHSVWYGQIQGNRF